MPVFNSERFVAEAIESVLGQTFGELELIVIDDGSTDRSREIVSQFARLDSRVRLVANHSNLGVGRASNRAWRVARAPYIARLDSDDVALPDRLSKQVSFLDAHPEVAVVGGALIRIDERGAHGSISTFPTSERGIRATLQRHNCIAHSAALIRRSALHDIGGYRLNEAGDFDLWLRLSERWPLANLAEPVVLYREHREQVTRTSYERQAAATLAARASAKARRAGRKDPLAASPELNHYPFALTHVAVRDIADRSARTCLELAAADAVAGHHRSSAELLAYARGTLGGDAARMFAAALSLKRADAHLAAHRPLAGLVEACSAVRRAPEYASGRLFSRFRDLSNGRRLW